MIHKSDFRISPRWPSLPKVGERDAAEISMFVAGRVVTRLLDVESDQTRDFVRASAVSLALWCADNWWRLRWEPIPDYRSATADWRLRHELTSASGGTIWPPVMIYGVGERVVVAPIVAPIETGGPIEYLPMRVSILPSSSFEQGMDEFLRVVVETCVRAQDGVALKQTFMELNAERQDTELASWRRLEARLGYDPDDAPEGLIESLTKQEERIGSDALEEAAVGHPGADASRILEGAISASEASRVTVDLSEAAAASAPSDRHDFDRPIWAIAEDAAGRLRRAVGRPSGPLLNQALSEILAIGWTTVKEAAATAWNLPYGIRMKESGAKQRVALQTRATHDRRFELARIIADAVWDKNATLGVISRAKTDRQRFQRAFAQSLLCPFADLRSEVNLAGPTDAQIEAAARRYHVHTRVVRTLLVNKGILPRETLGEQLEAA